MPVTDEGRLPHKEIRLQLVFNGLRSNHLSARCLQKLFFAVCNVEKAVLVHASDIAGAEPAIGIKCQRGVIRLPPVSGKDIRSPHQKLSIFCDATLYIGQRPAYRTDSIS